MSGWLVDAVDREAKHLAIPRQSVAITWLTDRARKEKLAGQAPTHPAHLRPRRHERESRSPLKAVRNAGLDVRFPYASSSALPAASRSFSMRRRE